MIETGMRPIWAHWGPAGHEPIPGARAHAESLVVWAALLGWRT